MPKPINHYGKTKLDGEEFIINNEQIFNFRTSWVYSGFKNNFSLILLEKLGSKIQVVWSVWFTANFLLAQSIYKKLRNTLVTKV